MELSPEEARVLACLIEKEAAVADSYPLTLNALRLACNQTTNREPIVAFDDRTVEAVLLSLKSMGLVRFVHPSHGGRTIRYRHVAGERWHLEPAELGVLAVLVLRGPQTVAEIRTRAERHLGGDDAGTVEEILDTLAARAPEPFAVRVARRIGEREQRWAATIAGVLPPESDGDVPAASAPLAIGDVDLARDLAELWSRVERLERLLGLDEDLASS